MNRVLKRGVYNRNYMLISEHLRLVNTMFESKKGEGKGVPLHAMERMGGEEVWLLLMFGLGHWMGVSGQHHAPAALCPRGKDPRYPLDRGLGGPQSRYGRRVH
jgi:hypothetical protein